MRLPCLRRLVRSQTYMQTDLNENRRLRYNTAFVQLRHNSRPSVPECKGLRQQFLNIRVPEASDFRALDQHAQDHFEAQARHCNRG